MATKEQVLELHRLHPLWNAGKIARRLGCGPSYVRETFKRNGIINPDGGPGFKNLPGAFKRRYANAAKAKIAAEWQEEVAKIMAEEDRIDEQMATATADNE